MTQHVVAIIGSRDWKHLDQVRAFVSKLAAKYPDAIVISGGAAGVDRAAEEQADASGLGVLSCQVIAEQCELVHNERAHYLLGQVALDYITLLLQEDHANAKAALLHRNTVIVQSATHVVAFWNRWSTGTLHAINHAHKLKRPVTIYHPD
jgi:predicted Rossmann fold nucleotide-binding protein DprA/Smf involved in DNA uptake